MIPVGILGATGTVGQHYVNLLRHHPTFKVSFLAASAASAGKTYGQALSEKGSAHFPDDLSQLPVHAIDDIDAAKRSCQLIFSAVSSDAAREFEERYAAAGLPVVSNAAYHRQSGDVPMIIPEINPDHLEIIPTQQRRRGWKSGFIIVKPNCSLQSYLIPLYPLHREFGIQKLIVTTMQAVSGAGYPGVASTDIIDNIVPYIAGEEEKSEIEPLKILGQVQGDQIIPAKGISISAHCNRVPVIDGHMACVSVSFERKPRREEILALWKSFTAAPQQLRLPSAPVTPIIYREEKDRPQPRLDRDADRGMAVSVGRLRDCPVLDLRFVALSHNTLRGAACGGILNAELALARGYL